MTKEDAYEEIRKDLQEQREELLREAEKVLNDLPGELNYPDMGDQATDESNRSFMLRLRERERKLLAKIEDAIERIDTKNYGICEECGSEISIKRLKARPVTSLCIDCKTLQEEEEKKRGT
jgi:DnaK suppressor protein